MASTRRFVSRGYKATRVCARILAQFDRCVTQVFANGASPKDTLADNVLKAAPFDKDAGYWLKRAINDSSSKYRKHSIKVSTARKMRTKSLQNIMRSHAIVGLSQPACMV